jgi:hypothetical protein
MRNTIQIKLEILAVTFETQKTTEEKIEKVARYKEALGLQLYLFSSAAMLVNRARLQVFPQLSDIMSFPTLIFIDKKGEIRKIHTGFSGPGTGEHYAEFVKETDAFY